MNSINVKCNKAKWAYDECFNEWFRKEFIVDKQKKFPEGYVPCEKLLQTYKACTQDELAKFGTDIRYVLGTRFLLSASFSSYYLT